MRRSAKAFFKRGQQKYHQGKYKEAIADFTRAIELDPRHLAAYMWRGLSYGELESYPEALVNYDQVIELDPSYVSAINLRGGALAELGLFEEALADFTQALKLRTHPETLACRGLVHLKLGNKASATEDLHAANELFLQDGNYQKSSEVQAILANPYAPSDRCLAEAQNLAVFTGKQADYQEAFSQLNNLISHYPFDAEIHLNRGTARSYLGDLSGGIADFTRAIQLNSKLPEAYFNRGNSYTLLSKYQAALDDFSQVIHLNRDYAAAYWARADVHYLLGDLQKACDDLDVACNLFQVQGERENWESAFQLLTKWMDQRLSKADSCRLNASTSSNELA